MLNSTHIKFVIQHSSTSKSDKCLIIPSDHLSVRICDDFYSDFKRGWLCLPNSVLILLGNQTMKIHLYPYVYSRFVPISGEHLTRSRCKNDPVMAGVSPPERALYNQKIILLFPTAPVILSSNKQPWEASRHINNSDSWKNTRVLHCRHDCAHRTRVWIRHFFSTHSHPPT